MVSNIYGIVAPFVMVLIGIEVVYCLVRRNGYYSFQDSLIGLGTMYLAQCANLAVGVGVILVYGWIYRNFALFRFEPTWWHYGLGYVAVDFLFYWFHRAGHRVNLLWAAHVPHHSAEELNYAVALRASLTQRAFSFLFYWPLAILGFSPDVILAIVATNLVYQLLPHTQVVGRFPRWIEGWLNTPYHHRMHHALNRIYWDKNYGGTFIVWDRLFGSSVEETEKPYYGVSIHPRSWDAFYLNFHWFRVLWDDMRAATHASDKLLLWFKPPGWRPRNLPPYPKTEDLSRLPKYRTPVVPGLHPYLFVQALATFGLVVWLMNGQADLRLFHSILLTVAIGASVTSWGALLENRAGAKAAEIVRLALTAALAWRLARFYGFPEPLGVAIGATAALSLGWVLFGITLPERSELEAASH